MKKSGLKNHKIRNQLGFTLIEIAIVIVVIGIFIGLGANLVGPLIKRAKYTQSRGIVDAAVDSVVAYAAGNEEIPDNGGGASDFKKIVSSPNDAFTKPLVYFPDSSLSVADSRKVCKQKAGEITVYTCDDSTCSTYDTINDVAFVFASGGTNMNIQAGSTTMPGGGACPTTTCIIVYEQDTASIDDYTVDTNNPDNYDDIVKWVTVNELRTKAGCTGPLIKILNNELPQGAYSLPSAYSATIFADGGIPFASGGDYKWCIDSGTSFPTGISNPASCTAPTNCSTLANDEGTWTQSTSLTISGTITADAGSFVIPVFVRDDSDGDITTGNDNCAQKSFALTVNP